MSSWLNQLQGLLGQATKTDSSSPSSSSSAPGNGLNQMLVPGAIGGLAGLLLGNKTARKWLTSVGGSVLLVGGGALAGSVLWNKYKERMGQAPAQPQAAMPQPAPAYAQSQPVQQGEFLPAANDERARRLITALVFAAKSDGHIDASERQHIEQQLQAAGVGPEGQAMIQQAIDRPLDPDSLAQGVTNGSEALEIYALSCAAIDVDHFMERSYLDALGSALNIPEEVRIGIQQDVAQEKSDAQV